MPIHPMAWQGRAGQGSSNTFTTKKGATKVLFRTLE
jgi:hypothetical protein